MLKIDFKFKKYYKELKKLTKTLKFKILLYNQCQGTPARRDASCDVYNAEIQKGFYTNRTQ